MMKRSLLVSVVLSLSFAGAARAQEDPKGYDRVEKGRYLSVLGDCAGCHTAPGGKPFAGGLALDTPFGRLLAPNITPDPETGIGRMSDSDFVAALHEGRGHNGRRLYPAMPYPAYTKMSRDDVLALRSYFRTVQPVSNAVEPNQLPFPFNIRLSMAFWNWLNFTPGRFQPNPQKSDEWNRGAYLVEGPAHCGTCHTPKTALGGDKTSVALSGATLQGWFAPDITANNHKGIGAWTKEELVAYLKTGANKHTLASGPMAEAITNSTSQMSDEDLNAIAAYLKDSRPSDGSKPQALAAGDATMRAGAAIYKDACAACHKDNGSGETHLFPKLAGSAIVQSDDPATLAHVVLNGARAVGTAGAPTAPAMPGFDWRLSDAQIAAVLTYIRNSWGNAAPAVAASAVKSQRESSAH
ncbi:c-type cytochrome [Rhodopseudomonas boonkerdii]|uniref:c-type cytochrome n=1 Tax=Rhodopseudomonas boonkerdii TaxID=475937 RepID=UPI001E335F48|nr:cytochrome c [Rhodopseudomonas boonkerdii]